MKIKNLEINDFRNYEAASVDFSEKTNIFFGNNAQGKTNILEAVYVCATTKSQRGSKENELIRFNADSAHIKLSLEKNGTDHVVNMHLKKGGRKSVTIDGAAIRKAAELYGKINIISFSPEDLGIVKNGPAERRRFIDMELSQLDRIYLDNLIKYQRTLVQRNTALKELEMRADYEGVISIQDEMLSAYGKNIISERRNFINEIAEILREIHLNLTDGKEELEIIYEPDSPENELKDRLRRNFEKDRILKTTGAGPHRDDIVFKINGNVLRRFGSQGQQRSAALSLKLAEIEYMRRKIKDTPVLLLDDVLSELDRERQTKLLDSIKDIQTIITCTGLEELMNHRIDYDTVYFVEDGKVTDYRERKPEEK